MLAPSSVPFSALAYAATGEIVRETRKPESVFGSGAANVHQSKHVRDSVKSLTQ